MGPMTLPARRLQHPESSLARPGCRTALLGLLMLLLCAGAGPASAGELSPAKGQIGLRGTVVGVDAEAKTFEIMANHWWSAQDAVPERGKEIDPPKPKTIQVTAATAFRSAAVEGNGLSVAAGARSFADVRQGDDEMHVVGKDPGGDKPFRARVVFWLAAAGAAPPPPAEGAGAPPPAGAPGPVPAPAPSGKLRREANRVWIDGIPALGWLRGQSCTYAGALAAALAVTPHPVAYEDIMGLSALAFRARWAVPWGEPGKRYWSMGIPSGEFPEEIEATQQRTGWSLRQEWRLDRMADPHMEELAPDIKASIDAGVPVVAYPTVENLTVSVIYGYEDDGKTWLVHGYFSQEGNATVAANKLGPMVLIPTGYNLAMTRRQAILESLKAAVGNWSRDDYALAGTVYLYGSKALGQWSSDIALADSAAAKLTEGEKASLMGVSWWNYAAWSDARVAAVRYLVRAAAEVGKEPAEHMLSAAKVYQQEADVLNTVYTRKDAFLGTWSGKTLANWTPTVRTRERAILAEGQRLESAAIKHLDMALQAAAEE